MRYPGLMPWHFGGPRELTLGEQHEYVTQHRKACAAEEKARRKGR